MLFFLGSYLALFILGLFFLKIKASKKQFIQLFILSFFLLVLIAEIANFLGYNILILMILFLEAPISIYYLKSKNQKMYEIFPKVLLVYLFVAFASQLSLLFSYIVFKTSFVELETATIYLVFNVLLSLFLVVLLTFFSGKIFAHYKLTEILLRERDYAWTLILTMLVGILAYFFFNFQKQNPLKQDDKIYLNSLFFLIILLGVLGFLMFIISREKILKKQAQEKDFLNQQLIAYIENLELMSDEMRKFKHDYLNILNSMEGFLEAENFTGLTDYYYKQIKKSGNKLTNPKYISGMIRNINVLELKGLLALKLNLAYSKGIIVMAEVYLPVNDVHIPTLEYCRCIGILLDNAIEAIEKESSKELFITLIAEKNELIFIIKNSCSEMMDLKIIYEEGYTTKQSNSGLGLKNLVDILDGYNNIALETKQEGGFFVQILETFR